MPFSYGRLLQLLFLFLLFSYWPWRSNDTNFSWYATETISCCATCYMETSKKPKARLPKEILFWSIVSCNRAECLKLILFFFVFSQREAHNRSYMGRREWERDGVYCWDLIPRTLCTLPDWVDSSEFFVFLFALYLPTFPKVAPSAQINPSCVWPMRCWSSGSNLSP